jgi:hypothetical protein
VRAHGAADVARRFFREHPKGAWLTVFGLVLLAVAALLIVWETGHECIRWSTRIDANDYGGVTTTRVCAETRPRWGKNVGK